MLEIKKITKNFGKKKVLKGISLNIEAGDIIGIIGPSGCGKSTFLRCINMLEIPTTGKIILDGQDITNIKDLSLIRRKIGMVFQQFNLFEYMTVLDNIILAPTKLKILTEEEAKKKAMKLLKEIDLDDKANYFPRELSGGQKQRVAIVRTLIMNPELILFDEPTSALDPEMIGEVTNLMRKLKNNGITMVVVSHEMNFIKNFAKKIVFMNDGKIIEEGTSEEIFKNPKSKIIKDFLSKTNEI